MKLQTHEKCFIPVRGIAPARSNRKHSDSGEHSRASGITGGRHSFSTGRRRCGTSLTGALREARRDAAPSPSLARLDHRGGTAHAPFWTGARGSCTRGAWTATLGVRAVCLAVITRARALTHTLDLEPAPFVWYSNAVLSPCSDRTGAIGAIAVAFGRH
jgi:hypothetical protein